jgi:hypothetical protein
VNGTAEQEFIAGSKHIGHQKHLLNLGAKTFCASLVDPTNILLAPLHIKLGIMKQFVAALPKTINCFKYLCKTFSHLSEAKLKEDIFIGPDIRQPMFDEDLLLTMTEVEIEAWIAFEMAMESPDLEIGIVLSVKSEDLYVASYAS